MQNAGLLLTGHSLWSHFLSPSFGQEPPNPAICVDTLCQARQFIFESVPPCIAKAGLFHQVRFGSIQFQHHDTTAMSSLTGRLHLARHHQAIELGERHGIHSNSKGRHAQQRGIICSMQHLQRNARHCNSSFNFFNLTVGARSSNQARKPII